MINNKVVDPRKSGESQREYQRDSFSDSSFDVSSISSNEQETNENTSLNSGGLRRVTVKEAVVAAPLKGKRGRVTRRKAVDYGIISIPPAVLQLEDDGVSFERDLYSEIERRVSLIR
jgi:hypothetical protein